MEREEFKLSNTFFLLAALALLALPITIIVLFVQAIRKKPKKKIGFICLGIVGAFVVFFILGGITSCNHEWIEATCTEPKTCTICGDTEGEALGHEWVEATCAEPKHCTRCGETEGEALGHDWEPATNEKPKTCKRCGETEGEKLNNKSETLIAVEEGYNRTLKRADEKGTDPDVAYNTLYNIASELKTAIENDDDEIIAWMSGQLYEEELSRDKMYSNVKKLLKYLVPEDEDKLSAIMKKFKSMDSVDGKITETEVNIRVTDMDKFVDEMELKAEYVGGVLAALECYDYSWVDDNAEKFLQFTDDGFTFTWKAVGNYKLKV